MNKFDDIIKIDQFKKMLVWGTFGVAFFIFPLVAPSQYYVHIFVLAMLYAILALGLSVVVGFTGLLDLGYVAFYAVGAYSYAILSVWIDLPFGIGILVGGTLAASAGIILGFPTIRARGDYLALVTLGFGEAIRLLLRNWDGLTNGPRGIRGIHRPSIFGFVASQPIHFYYIILLFGIVTIWFVHRLKASPFGQRFIAIRDDENAAEAIGINPAKMKLYAFAIGAFFAGVMGTFFAGWQQFVSPESFSLLESIIILSMVILGGMGNIPGTIIAAIFLVLLPEFLRGFLEYRMLIYGIIFVVVVIFQEKKKTLFLRSRKKDRTSDSNMTLINTFEMSSIKASQPPVVLRKRSEYILLQCHHLFKHFNGIQAIDDVTLELYDREILGLIGPNGAGKTTLFNCMSGSTFPESGQIIFEKEIIFSRHNNLLRSDNKNTKHIDKRLKAYQTAELGIARTFQNTRLFKSMTVHQNIAMGFYCDHENNFISSMIRTQHYSKTEQECHILVDDLLALFELNSIRNTIVSNLPLGYQRKVELVRALATTPKLLLLDEPAAGLNESEKKEFRMLIDKVLAAIPLSIVLIEHDMSVLMDVSGRVICMNRGKIIAQGTPNEIRKNSEVKIAYLGEDEDIPKLQGDYAPSK